MSAVLLPAPAGPLLPSTPPPAGLWPRRWTFTRDQFLKIGDLGIFGDHRVQLVFGEIIEMEPMTWPHSLTVGLVGTVLRTVFAAGHWVSVQCPFLADDSFPVPDLAVYSGSMRDYTHHPTAAALIVEIADSSLNFDMTTKAELYATAGVPEYWVVDVVGRRLLIYRDPAPLPAGIGTTAYRSLAAHGPADTIAPLAAPHAAVAVGDLLP